MITLTTDKIESLCERCRYPMTVTGEDLEAICEKCPLTEAERMEKIKKEAKRE